MYGIRDTLKYHGATREGRSPSIGHRERTRWRRGNRVTL
jgi:hypothetical protein